MKKLYIWAAWATLATLTCSCSAALQRRYDQRHGISTSSTSTERSSREPDTDRNSRANDPTYRKDYDRVADSKAGTTSARVGGSADYNQQLLNQYAEMDKLAEVVLYELDNLENRYNNLLNEYKNAKSSSRQVMAMELDKISDDRLVLYKAYTNIYRNGKSDWVNVRREVDETLREIRKKN